MSRRNTFKAVADELMVKFTAEKDAPATLEKKPWLIDFAITEFRNRPIAEIKAPEILEALRSRDPDRAEELTRTHTLHTGERFLALAEREQTAAPAEDHIGN